MTARQPRSLPLPKDVIARLRPSDRVYDRYLSEAYQYRASIGTGRTAKPGDDLVAASFRCSRLFGREYLVVQANDHWFERTFNGCDAVMWDRVVLPWLIKPATVVIPYSLRHRRDRAWQAVLEHEYAHVNQSLAGRFPRAARTTTQLLTEYESRVAIEYEATVASSRWSREQPFEGLDDEQTMAFRAVAQGLERLFAGAIRMSVETGRFAELVLDNLTTVTQRALAQAGCPERVHQPLATNTRLLWFGAANTVKAWGGIEGPSAAALLGLVEGASLAAGAPVRDLPYLFRAR